MSRKMKDGPAIRIRSGMAARVGRERETQGREWAKQSLKELMKGKVSHAGLSVKGRYATKDTTARFPMMWKRVGGLVIELHNSERTWKQQNPQPEQRTQEV